MSSESTEIPAWLDPRLNDRKPFGRLLIVAGFAVILTSAKTTAEERSRVLAFIPLFIGSAAFFALFQQQFTVITLYSDTRLDRMLGDWEMPIPWVQSFNPFFIILLAPVFAALWTKLGRRQPNTPVKFGVGIWGLYCIAWMWQHLGRRSFKRRAEEREFVDLLRWRHDRPPGEPPFRSFHVVGDRPPGEAAGSRPPRHARGAAHRPVPSTLR